MRMAIIRRGVLFAGLWLALAGSEPGSWLAGVPAVGAAMALSLRLLPPSTHALRLAPMLRLLWDFARGSWAGGLDVARRAFDPRLPLQPGWVRHRLALSPGPSRALLGNLLSLVPGTLAAGEAGEQLLVHCLDTQRPIGQEVAWHERCLQDALGQAREGSDG